MNRSLAWVIAFSFTCVTYTAAQQIDWPRAPRPAVQLWTLWATDEANLPVRSLLRFTSLDACYAASLRHGLTVGETATCLPYRLGDF